MKKDKKFFQGHERLAEEREKLFATQQEAADFFGVTRVTWGQCERGNATPSGDVLAGLAQQGADVLYILTGQRSGYAVARPPSALMVAEPSPAYAKNKEEEALLDNYRNSPPEGQSAIRTTSAALAKPKSAKDKRGKAA